MHSDYTTAGYSCPAKASWGRISHRDTQLPDRTEEGPIVQWVSADQGVSCQFLGLGQTRAQILKDGPGLSQVRAHLRLVPLHLVQTGELKERFAHLVAAVQFCQDALTLLEFVSGLDQFLSERDDPPQSPQLAGIRDFGYSRCVSLTGRTDRLVQVESRGLGWT